MNEYIQIDHLICGGKPVIRGTRIMIKNILGMIAGGYTIDKVVEAYPELTIDVVQKVLEYIAEVIDEEQVFAYG
jgi:uncharacterized protein (DUF433 family)